MKTLKMTKTLGTLIALSLTACDRAPTLTTATVDTAQPQTLAAPADPVPTASSGPTTFQLTYKSMTVSRAPVNGFSNKTYVSTGSCVSYQSQTYCWDDGLKDLNFTYMHVAVGGNYSYFNFGPYSGGFDVAPGQLTTDTMTAPTLITANITSKFNAHLSSEPSQSPDYVNTHGTSHSVTCYESNGILECGDFSIDLNQAHL